MGYNRENLEYIAEQIEQGIEETGRDNDIQIEAYTIFKNKKGKLPDFNMVFQAFSMFVADNFAPATCKVIFKLLAINQFENFISIDIKTISEEMKMSVTSVNRAIKELKLYNIITIHKHVGDKRRNDYFINPCAVWRGTSIKRDKQIDILKKNNIQLEFFSSTEVLKSLPDNPSIS